jgi:hypothetical protein
MNKPFILLYATVFYSGKWFTCSGELAGAGDIVMRFVRMCFAI